MRPACTSSSRTRSGTTRTSSSRVFILHRVGPLRSQLCEVVYLPRQPSDWRAFGTFETEAKACMPRIPVKQAINLHDSVGIPEHDLVGRDSVVEADVDLGPILQPWLLGGGAK